MRLSDYLQSVILCLGPVIVGIGVWFAWYIWSRQVRHGKNGIYQAIVYTSLLYALSWVITLLFYVLDGNGYYDVYNIYGVGVRLGRVLVCVGTLLNFSQWYRALTKEE